jgi:hypothetical protein
VKKIKFRVVLLILLSIIIVFGLYYFKLYRDLNPESPAGTIKQEDDFSYPDYYSALDLPKYEPARIVEIDTSRADYFGVKRNLKIKLETNASSDEVVAIANFFDQKLLSNGWTKHPLIEPGRRPDAWVKDGLYYQYILGHFPDDKVEVTIILGEGLVSR